MGKRILFILVVVCMFAFTASAQFNWSEDIDMERYAFVAQTEKYAFFFDTKTLKFPKDEYGKPATQILMVRQLQYLSEEYKDQITKSMKEKGQVLPPGDRVAYYLSHIFYDLKYDRYSLVKTTLYTEKGRIVSDTTYDQEYRALSPNSAGALCLVKIKQYVKDNQKAIMQR